LEFIKSIKSKFIRYALPLIAVIPLLFAGYINSVSADAKKGQIFGLNYTVNGDPRTSLAFCWQTASDDKRTAIRYEMPAGGGFQASRAVTETGRETVFATDDGTRYVHKVVLTGLRPGTSYSYRVSDGAGGYSAAYTFSTLPDTPSGTHAFTFLAYTDTQAVTQKQYGDYFEYSLEKALDKKGREYSKPAFILHTGDIVDNGGSERNQWNSFFSAATSLRDNLFVPTEGNHEAMYGGTANFLNHFDVPDTYYSFVYGSCLFMILNTSGDIAKQIKWMEQTVASNKGVKWKIVAMHKGPYGGAHANDADVIAIRRALPPEFDKLGVSLVLEGHDHAYMRSRFMYGGNAVSNIMTDGEYVNPKGTVYIVTGACGPKVYAPVQKPWTLFTWRPADSDVNSPDKKLYDAVTVCDKWLEVGVYTADNKRIDSIKIAK